MLTQHHPCRASGAADDEEASLLGRLRAGDDHAFDRLVRTHAGPLFAVAKRLLTSEADACDAVQEAFLAAFRGLATFDGRARLATWLHRITINACLMRLRHRRRHGDDRIEALLPRYGDDGHQLVDSRPWFPTADLALGRAELQALIRAKIDELPDGYREVLVLRDLEDLDTDETAKLLGTSCGAIKTRLHRARQALRTLLEPHFVEVAP